MLFGWSLVAYLAYCLIMMMIPNKPLWTFIVCILWSLFWIFYFIRRKIETQDSIFEIGHTGVYGKFIFIIYPVCAIFFSMLAIWVGWL